MFFLITSSSVTPTPNTLHYLTPSHVQARIPSILSQIMERKRQRTMSVATFHREVYGAVLNRAHAAIIQSRFHISILEFVLRFRQQGGPNTMEALNNLLEKVTSASSSYFYVQTDLARNVHFLHLRSFATE